jgi:hypothetical protein
MDVRWLDGIWPCSCSAARPAALTIALALSSGITGRQYSLSIESLGFADSICFPCDNATTAKDARPHRSALAVSI